MAVVKRSNPEAIVTSDPSNQSIKEGLESLDKKKVSKLMDCLSSNNRKLCLEIIQENNDHYITLQKQQKLEKVITEVQESPVDSPKDKDSLSFKVYTFITDYLLGLFGFLTAHKATVLMESQLSDSKIFTQEDSSTSSTQETQPIQDSAAHIDSGSTIKDKIFDRNFIDSIENVTFQNCIIKRSFFSQSTLTNCRFENCTIEDTMFVDAKLEGVTFNNCTIKQSSFEEAHLKDCSFTDVKMPSTHFLQASVDKSQIENSDLTDTVFFKALPLFSVDETSKQSAKVTKPITTMLANPSESGFSVPKVASKIETRTDSILLRVALYSQKDSFVLILKEMNVLKTDILSRGAEFSMAKRVIDTVTQKKTAYPLAHRIVAKATEIAHESSAIFLPGGEDIPALFYEGKEMGLSDFRRSLLELGLISNAFHKGIPLMGVCRGFQMANVYFGAKLVDVEGHEQVVQKLNLNKEEKTGLYAHVMKDTLLGVSFHHQAVEEKKGTRAHLEVSAAYDDLVKASEPKAGGASPMILLQFHPEFYAKPSEDQYSFGLSHENELFWNILGDSAKAYQAKQAALKEIRDR